MNTHTHTTELDFINFPDDSLPEQIEKQWKHTKNPHLDYVDNLNFFYISDDSETSRKQLRGYLSLNKMSEAFINTVLVSEVKDLGFIGWEEDIVSFFPLNEVEENFAMNCLVDRLMKFPFYKGSILKKLKIKSKGHFELVDTQDILFCSGSGAFTEIFLSNGKKRVESKPLSDLEERLSSVSSMKRLGKSYIVNRNRVLKISGNDVWFISDSNIPNVKAEFGNSYIKRLRKFIYWY